MYSLYAHGTSLDQPAPGDARFIGSGAREPGPAVRSVAIIEEEPELYRREAMVRGCGCGCSNCTGPNCGCCSNC